METPSNDINNLDLEPIILSVIKEHKWSRQCAEEIAVQYRRLWYIRLKYPTEILVPFEELDKFWHHHILHTKKYAEDCQNVFGSFFHHTPGNLVTHDSSQEQRLGASLKKGGVVDLTASYYRTVELITREFQDAR